MEQQAFTTADADLIGTASGNDRGEIRLWERRVRYRYGLLLIQFKLSFLSSAEPPHIQWWPYLSLQRINCDNNVQCRLVCHFHMEPGPRSRLLSESFAKESEFFWQWKGVRTISKFLSSLFTSINMYILAMNWFLCWPRSKRLGFQICRTSRDIPGFVL